jgi:hypothetical protein
VQSDYEVVFAIPPGHVPGFSLPEGEGTLRHPVCAGRGQGAPRASSVEAAAAKTMQEGGDWFLELILNPANRRMLPVLDLLGGDDGKHEQDQARRGRPLRP